MKKIIFLLSSLISLILSNITLAAYPLPAKAPHGMVVSNQHYATEVGVNILKKGGNAIDAAVAMGYALAVVSPCCGNLGGGGFMTIHLANGENIFLNFRERAPLNVDPAKMYFDKNGKPLEENLWHGYSAAGIPGTVLGLNTALAKFGTLSLHQVIFPAISLAENGFILQFDDIDLFKKYHSLFAKYENVAKIFLKNGNDYQVGDVFKQPELANTLKLISQQGTAAFYEGPISQTLVKASQENGGVFTEKDFKEYRVQWLKPIFCHYHDLTIISSPPPSSGGVTLCQILKTIEPYPLAMLGFHSALSVHYNVEAMRYAYADRNNSLGDPDFIHNPIEEMLSPKHIAYIQSRIQRFHAGNSRNMHYITAKSPEKPQTTAYAAVDKFGNAVSVTYTLNGYFGSGVIAGNTGFLLNDEMDDFTLQPGTANKSGLVQGAENAIKPGKRPLSSMTPTIVLKNDEVDMLLGAAGASTIITQVLLALENVVDFGMDISSAINAPRYHMQWLPDTVYMEPFAFSFDTEEKLSFMGYLLTSGSPFKTPTWGKAVGIKYDEQAKLWTGANDNRTKEGLAMGY